MADIAQAMRYKIDVKNGLVKQPMVGVLMRGDKNANRIIAQLVDGDKTVSLDGVTVTGKFFRGGDGVEITLEGTASGNEASVLLDKHCYAVDGYFEASIKLTTGGATRTILTITGHVESDGEGGILDIENVIPSVADIVAQYQRMQEVTEQTNAAMQKANEASERANTAAGAANQKADAANAAATEAGAAAGKIDNMTVSATALDTGQPPTAALSEVDGHYLLSLGLPRGATGATPQISVQVTTGAPGSQASVSVTGTAENPVIHLTIPRGDTGEIGALKINGKTPDASGAVTLGAGDVGALAAGATAVNSAKLGGKAPEYYIQPRNLLDNSDFEIAQAGYGGKHGSKVYAADRWMQNDTTERTYTYTTKNGHGALKCSTATRIQQNLHLVDGQDYTAAFYINNTLYVLNFTANGADNGSGAIWVNKQSDGTYMFIVSSIPAGGIVSEPVLYIGTYTADTLPPYVPKGYTAELAECSRWYTCGTKQIAKPYAFGSNTPAYLCDIKYPVPMEVEHLPYKQPTVHISNIKTWVNQANAGVDAEKNIGDEKGFNSINLSAGLNDAVIQFDYESISDL